MRILQHWEVSHSWHQLDVDAITVQGIDIGRGVVWINSNERKTQFTQQCGHGGAEGPSCLHGPKRNIYKGRRPITCPSLDQRWICSDATHNPDQTLCALGKNGYKRP